LGGPQGGAPELAPEAESAGHDVRQHRLRRNGWRCPPRCPPRRVPGHRPPPRPAEWRRHGTKDDGGSQPPRDPGRRDQARRERPGLSPNLSRPAIGRQRLPVTFGA
jgi:hypothetical protein